MFMQVQRDALWEFTSGMTAAASMMNMQHQNLQGMRLQLCILRLIAGTHG